MEDADHAQSRFVNRDRLEAVLLAHVLRRELVQDVRREYLRVVEELESPFGEPSRVSWPHENRLCLPVFPEGRAVPGQSHESATPLLSVSSITLNAEQSSAGQLEQSSAHLQRIVSEPCSTDGDRRLSGESQCKQQLHKETGATKAAERRSTNVNTTSTSVSTVTTDGDDVASASARECESLTQTLPLTTTEGQGQGPDQEKVSDAECSTAKSNEPHLTSPMADEEWTSDKEQQQQHQKCASNGSEDVLSLLATAEEGKEEEEGAISLPVDDGSDSCNGDGESLMKLRARLAMELVWMKQAIASRQAYLQLKKRIESQENA